MGFSVATTVLAGAYSQNLTDVATAKEELSIPSGNTSNDTWLTRAIGQVSRAIASHTKRTFAPEYVEDAFDIEQDAYPYQTPGGVAHLPLTRWPVLAVQSVVQTPAPGSSQTLVVGTDYRIDMATGMLLRLNPFTGAVTTWEATPVAVRYVAGYGLYVTEAGTVPASAPYAITVSAAAAFSCAKGVTYADSSPLTLAASSPAAGQYSVARGVYTFNAADAGKVLTITYATMAAPDDLTEACLRLVSGRFSSKGRDPSLIQRDTPGVGTERWWFGGAPGQKGAFPPDIAGMLEPYCMPVAI